jgi:hypothetical protein
MSHRVSELPRQSELERDCPCQRVEARPEGFDRGGFAYPAVTVYVESFESSEARSRVSNKASEEISACQFCWVVGLRARTHSKARDNEGCQKQTMLDPASFGLRGVSFGRFGGSAEWSPTLGLLR